MDDKAHELDAIWERSLQSDPCVLERIDSIEDLRKKLVALRFELEEAQKHKGYADARQVVGDALLAALSPNQEELKRFKLSPTRQPVSPTVSVALNEDELSIILHSLIVRVSHEVALQFVKDSVDDDEYKGNDKRWRIAAEISGLKNPGEKLRSPKTGRLEWYKVFIDKGLKPRPASERAFQHFHLEKYDCFQQPSKGYCKDYIKELQAYDKWLCDEIDRKKDPVNNSV